MIIPLWVKALILAAVIGTIGLMLHHWKESLREEGREEVRKEWAAARKAAEAVATAANRRAEIDSAAREAQREKDFRNLRIANGRLQAQLMGACVDPTLLASMRDAVNASNDKGPGETPPGPPAAARPPDGLAVAEWFNQVAFLYRQCREQVIGWIEWDDRRVKQ